MVNRRNGNLASRAVQLVPVGAAIAPVREQAAATSWPPIRSRSPRMLRRRKRAMAAWRLTGSQTGVVACAK